MAGTSFSSADSTTTIEVDSVPQSVLLKPYVFVDALRHK